MRTKSFAISLVAAALLPGPSTRADVGCVSHRFSLVGNGVTYIEGSTRVGRPCQMGFGLAGSNIEALLIVVRPLHGILGVSGQEGNRRYIAYAPSPGFVGRDRFEVNIQFTPPAGGTSRPTRLKVDMNVTP